MGRRVTRDVRTPRALPWGQGPSLVPMSSSLPAPVVVRCLHGWKVGMPMLRASGHEGKTWWTELPPLFCRRLENCAICDIWSILRAHNQFLIVKTWTFCRASTKNRQLPYDDKCLSVTIGPRYHNLLCRPFGPPCWLVRWLAVKTARAGSCSGKAINLDPYLVSSELIN